MTSLVQHITIDCSDPYRLALFWAGVLGSSVSGEDAPGDPEALVEAPGAALLFVMVPEPRHGKNRVHLDLRPEDRTRDAEVERLLELGAALVADHRKPNGRGWVTLADPEGNEFCVECGTAERALLTGARLPVTADDVDLAVRLVVDTFAAAAGRDWRVPAGGLAWDCWETAEHLGDDLFAYAVQLGPRRPPQDREVAFRYAPDREGGPANSVFADPSAGVAGLLETVEASGALLAAMVRTASPDLRAHHVFGVSDPEGFAAMGVVETLVHAYDIARGLGLEWAPPGDLCGRVLARLFPDAPDDADRWTVLLWSTGRADLPGRERLTTWRWYGAPPTG
ncbi:VOC family protein [Streptomyces nitrosporeus]|uniref:VOC family protein n=1 Tax=Streptomyces nitrosporeus TaxID=28894 RepID=A0A5J6FK37_9ACTN|nr:VOC family protein [Streptomyces nitrosporeus]QEU76798.1 VOC family protein [Streptomyces nitrosporeus]